MLIGCLMNVLCSSAALWVSSQATILAGPPSQPSHGRAVAMVQMNHDNAAAFDETDEMPPPPPGRERGEFGRSPGPRRGGDERDGPPMARPGGEIARRVRAIVREAVDRALRENDEHMRHIIREEIGRAMHRGDGPPPGGRGDGRPREPRDGERGFGMNIGPGGHEGHGPRRPGGPPPDGERRGPGENGGPPQRGPRGGHNVDGEHPRLDALFDRLDSNHDGALTPDEVRRPERFNRADRNCDGRIDRNELRETIRQRMQEQRRGGQPGDARPGDERPPQRPGDDD